jgi:hypothetical protein
MAKKKRHPKRDAAWAEAKRLCRLSVEDVRLAKELGLNPRKLVKNRPNPSEPWKLPVHLWIRELYGRLQEKQARKKAGQSLAPEPEKGEPPLLPLPVVSADTPDDYDEGAAEDDPIPEDFPDDPWDAPLPWQDTGPPDRPEIGAENERMLRRQRDFRRAAEFVARAFAAFPEVQKVVLFGSVAVPLPKEVPRFRAYRRAGIAIYHECKDVDLAVWLTDLGNLRALGKARGRAVNQLLAETGACVAHHQVDVFVLEAGTDHYQGRLCIFGECPKAKRECLVPGCGARPFLQLHADFTLRSDALRPERTVVLFDRATGVAVSEEEAIPF